MRVECERCHALVAASLEVDGDGVTVSCGACGGSFRAPARPRPAPVTPSAAEPGCVKCGAPMTADPACPRCGLARTKAASWAAADQPSAPELATAWTATVAAWDEPAAHDRVAALALELAALPWLARRYREVERARPTDGVARVRLDRIAVMTLAALEATATVPSPGLSNRRAAYWVLTLVVLLVGAGLLAAKTSSMQRHAPRRPAIPAPESAPRARPVPSAIEPGAPGR